MFSSGESFPRFWFEGNQFFGWVESEMDLEELFERYNRIMTKDELCKSACNKEGSKEPVFGVKSEFSGKTTLKSYLDKHLGKGNY